jgi:hypothetical protein
MLMILIDIKEMTFTAFWKAKLVSFKFKVLFSPTGMLKSCNFGFSPLID